MTQSILPIHPHPLPDELLSSWMIRLAHGNLMKAHTMCAIYFGNNRQIWNRDIDVLAPNWMLEGLSSLSGVMQDDLELTTLRSYESIVYEHLSPNNRNPWILAQGIYHRTRRLHGLQYCPLCLFTDARPYYRKQWRLSFFTECDVHHVLMQDACYKCDAPVVFFRGDIGHKSEVAHHKIHECHVCQADLSRAPAQAFPWPDWRLAVAYQSLLSTYWLGWSYDPMPRTMYSHLLLAVVRQMCGLLVTSVKKARIPITEIEHHLGFDYLPIISNSIVFEQRRVNERHRLLVAATWLMMDWPDKFQHYYKQWGLSRSLLVKDMLPLPFLFQSAFYQ